MMPIIAHNLFESMQIAIGSIQAFTERCVRGIVANRAKAEGWLARNAIIITALNPLIGYAAGAELVKQALERDQSIFELARQKAFHGELKRYDRGKTVTVPDIEKAIKD